MDAVVGLGSNLGRRAETLAAAIRSLARSAEVVAVSPLYETDPVGPPQPDFLNAAVRLSFGGSPRDLFRLLLAIEREHGRVRTERWGPRTLDLDLLFVVGVQLEEADLVIPHPRLMERAFALAPLVDVLPDAVHPRTLELLSKALARLPVSGLRRVADPEWARRAE